ERGVVLRGVAQRRIDPALGRAEVAADRVDLGDKGDVGTGVVCLDGRSHARAAGTDDKYVVLPVHLKGRYRKIETSRLVRRGHCLLSTPASVLVGVSGLVDRGTIRGHPLATTGAAQWQRWRFGCPRHACSTNTRALRRA